jgi:hypothetical protein|tara:strand:- start:3486 stop:4835 length:1350 start_codon:yes stop_codon:yes gene_type:complete
MNNIKKAKRTVRNDLLLVLALSLMLLPSALNAATITTTDDRWLAWMGCWSPKEVQQTGQENLASLCVINSEETNGLEILTIVDGSIVERRAVGLNGAPKEITSEDCSGIEAFTFSDDGRHIFLQTELLCDGGQRKETGIMSMTSSQEWLEVRAIGVGEETIPWVLRYGVASEDVFQAAGVEGIVTRNTFLARLAFTAPLTLANVVEAGSKVDPQAIEAWVLESAQPFALDGDILKRISYSGVAPNVLDAIIAVSFPNEFVLERFGTDTNGEFQGSRLGAQTNGRGPIARQNTYSGSNYYAGAYQTGPFRYGYGRYANPFGGAYDPFLAHNPNFTYDPFRSYSFGYRYGYGFGSGYSPYPYLYRSHSRNFYDNSYWGAYRSPTQVTGRVRSNSWSYDNDDSRARVVPGRGYTRGGRGTPSTAAPSGGRGSPPASGTRTAKPRGGKPGGSS